MLSLRQILIEVSITNNSRTKFLPQKISTFDMTWSLKHITLVIHCFSCNFNSYRGCMYVMVEHVQWASIKLLPNITKYITWCHFSVLLDKLKLSRLVFWLEKTFWLAPSIFSVLILRVVKWLIPMLDWWSGRSMLLFTMTIYESWYMSGLYLSLKEWNLLINFYWKCRCCWTEVADYLMINQKKDLKFFD